MVWISAATSPGNGAGVTREFFGISNTLLTGTLFLRKAAETKGLFNDWVLEMCLKKLPEIPGRENTGRSESNRDDDPGGTGSGRYASDPGLFD